MSKRLCDLPQAPAESCCADPIAPVAVPLEIVNEPGLSAIGYRIGTFASFRRTMLNRIADPLLLDPMPNPFAAWREGSPNDYQTMFVELWAYLADILTFYQERIANEAYVPTATQLSSLMRLAETIGYRPQPGASASALVAFLLEKGKAATIPASFRVSTRASGGKPAAVFETSEAINAVAALSKILVATTAPHHQFAPLAAYTALHSQNVVDQTRAIVDIFGLGNTAFAGAFTRRRRVTSATVVTTVVVRRTVVFAGTNPRIAVGDWLFAVANEDATSGEIRELCRVVAVTPNDELKTTSVVWEESETRARDGYGSAGTIVKVYAFRVVATPFGSNAPAAELSKPAKPWDDIAQDPNKKFFFLPPFDESRSRLSLDSIYDTIDVTPNSPGWVLLHRDGAALPQPFRATDAKTTGRAQYEISGKVTRLTLRDQLPVETFPLRTTTVYAASELLPLQVRLPLPESIGGTALILDGALPELRQGQLLLVEGLPDEDGATTKVSASVTIAEPPVVDRASGVTTVRVTPPLRGFVTASAVVYANVANATHGETVRNEILGSGNGAAFQTFTLKKSPVTYLPAKSAEGLAAVESTLAVTVNNVLWHEEPTLLESASDARVFVTKAASDAELSVTFGDGVNGARVPTGRDNVAARYRKGIGTGGNVNAGAIQVLLDNLAGVQKVTNPIATTGGADAESPAQIRTNAPESVRTFSRAISVDDYAALALTYPAVAKASAAWITLDPETQVALARPYIRLTIATTDGQPLSTQRVFAADLRAFLDRRRDPNVALQIVDFTPVNIELTASIEVLDDHPREATRAAVESAARARFAFERLGFGESLRLSAVYAVLQTIAGVRSVTITDLRRGTDAIGTQPGDVLIASTELAILHALSISAAGGFVDQ